MPRRNQRRDHSPAAYKPGKVERIDTLIGQLHTDNSRGDERWRISATCPVWTCAHLV